MEVVPATGGEKVSVPNRRSLQPLAVIVDWSRWAIGEDDTLYEGSNLDVD